MARSGTRFVDVGRFIRQQVIPRGMSVTDAARRLGVGRPALSNLLNGKMALTSRMALRLEKTFGADRKQLLHLQSTAGRELQRDEDRAVPVGAYVPDFLTIKARQIEGWTGTDIEARQHLPVLLRRLIHATGRELRRVDFPGFDNAQRHGWDGWVEAEAATPWVPAGQSGWEFGVGQRPRDKAEHDYQARLAMLTPEERADCTFVFVTPRNWPGKNDWAESKNASGDWKSVRAFDASDLEQWLETTVAPRIWLAGKLGMPTSGFQTIGQCWERWAAASEPPMTATIFKPSLDRHEKGFRDWLRATPDRPFTVAADSREEAVAFIACLLRQDDLPAGACDRAVLFESADTLRLLAPSSQPFIAVVCSQETERAIGEVYRRHHCIVVRPRNAVDPKPNIALDLLDHDSFMKALAVMGIDRDRAEQLERESGRSPTILLRRLSEVDAIKKPQWAGDAQTARDLIPMALVGAWNAQSSADCEVFEVLADRPYQKIEVSFAHLRQFDDSPVWSAGQHRGVASKIDAVFAINKHVTERDLKEFFWLAEYVLSEADPALELPEDQRWAAGLYDKVRDHSAALREGVCETLVILSVHGNNLFRNRLGIDVEACVSSLIHRLLTPLTLEKLLSHNNDLPRYAEAAPDTFMSLLETDLQQTRPVVLGLLEPADSTPVFGWCPRTGLLWALECLAWKHIVRVSTLLAKLSGTVIEDNWSNKPIASLAAIYRFWMPQTAASLEERMTALETLTRRFPDIGWQICVEQFTAYQQTGFDSCRPRWRNDATGAGRRVTGEERKKFILKAIDLALAWPKHDQKTLGDLVERLQPMPEKDQAKVWDLIDTWAATETDDSAKADLRERIRGFAFTRFGHRRGLSDTTRDRARRAYVNLESCDSVVRHAWLFAQKWIEFSADESEDGDIDYAKHEERIHGQRCSAMAEIWTERGFEGVKALLSGGGVADVVGSSLVLSITDADAQADFLRQCLSVTGDLEKEFEGCIRGFLLVVEDEARDKILLDVATSADTNRTLRLFLCGPFGQGTWRLLDRFDNEVRDRYWQEVFPYWNRFREAELIELIDRLLEAQRPHAAFHTVRFAWRQIETSRLKRLLLAVATVDTEPSEHYRLDAHQISDALKALDGRPNVSPDEMAQLEFLYVDALDRSEHGIPNLERQIANSPALFVEVLAFVYKRSHGGQDPPAWRIEDPKRRDAMAVSCHRLLGQMKHIPGTGTDGKIDDKVLLAWVTEVRRLCAEHDRAAIGDQHIGQLLSRAPTEEDGIWPCQPVCEAMERIASTEIGNGFHIGVCNGRGVVHRSVKGGAQERDLAATYRSQAKQRAFEYPYVSSVIESIAAAYDREAKWWDDEAEIEKRRAG
ncbi:MAG: helix-turn-helix domain-containing protein [Bryobacterales bacterium]|nr:helix-turn-helix domain-containing protein [Bryobacterales bacterium]